MREQSLRWENENKQPYESLRLISLPWRAISAQLPHQPLTKSYHLPLLDPIRLYKRLLPMETDGRLSC